MKPHTTNYINTFIEVAVDCPASKGEVPPLKGGKETIATIQFELSKDPYRFTSDEILFKIYALRNDLTEAELDEARVQFFSKGQPCFRTSPLTKRYGWGVHHDKNGKIALYGCETEEYRKFVADKTLEVVRAMRTGK
ncbi:hypothetical protein GZH53_12730 [Flavihumibacter sp. R14]|nr:hypothetical protein [Flavihumibacter soli]